MKTSLFVIGVIMGIVSSGTAQTWQYTGSLNTGRRHSTINVLQDGRVLITGGDNEAGNVLSSCEIFDPATASWTYSATMSVPREMHTSNELADGRIVIIGGNMNNVYSSNVTGSIEIYDPTTDTWSNGGSLQLARQNHTATLLNDSLILVCGGFTGNDITNECEIYNVNTHQSTVIEPMLQNRHDASAILLADGKVLMDGGRTGGSISTYLAECEIFDPSTDSWSATPSMNQPREYGTLVRFSDNTVLAAGGRATPYVTAPGAEIFDPANPGWTSISPILQPTHWPGATVLPGDRLLMTGGIITFDYADASGQTMNNTATCEWYDKPNQRWFYAPTLNQTLAQQAAVELTQNVNPNLPTDMVLLAGGMVGTSEVTSNCEVLDVSSSALTYYIAHQQDFAAVSNQRASTDQMKVVYNDNKPFVDLIITSSESVKTQLISMDGSLAYQDETFLGAGEHQLVLPQNLASGMYLVRVIDGTNNFSSKILIGQ